MTVFLVVVVVTQVVLAYTQIVVIAWLKNLWSSQRYLINRSCPLVTPEIEILADVMGDGEPAGGTTKPE